MQSAFNLAAIGGRFRLSRLAIYWRLMRAAQKEGCGLMAYLAKRRTTIGATSFAFGFGEDTGSREHGIPLPVLTPLGFCHTVVPILNSPTGNIRSLIQAALS